ncbi:MAG: hypothetical protein ACRC18_04385 [Cetobacterium sp.]
MYYKYLDNMTLEEIEILRLLYRRMNNFTEKRCSYRLRELSDSCDKRLKMNKDKLKRILDELEGRNVIRLTEKSNGNKDSMLEITIDNAINN